jgi:hypothetical protein
MIDDAPEDVRSKMNVLLVLRRDSMKSKESFGGDQ